MSTENTNSTIDGQLSAAERILAEKAISGGYKFAPGITIHPPSKKDAERMGALVESLDTDNPTEEDVLGILSVLLGDQYKPVMDYLDDFPVEGYPELFADLFTNLLQMVPKSVDVEGVMGEAEVKWRASRPDLFATVDK